MPFQQTFRFKRCSIYGRKQRHCVAFPSWRLPVRGLRTLIMSHSLDAILSKRKAVHCWFCSHITYEATLNHSGCCDVLLLPVWCCDKLVVQIVMVQHLFLSVLYTNTWRIFSYFSINTLCVNNNKKTCNLKNKHLTNLTA